MSVFDNFSSNPDGSQVSSRVELAGLTPRQIAVWNRLTKFALVFTVVLTAWYVASSIGLISDRALPSPASTLDGFIQAQSGAFGDASLLSHLGYSLFRLAFGIGIGASLGVGLSVLVTRLPRFLNIVKPVASAMVMMPVIAVFPLILIWWGVSEVSIVMTVSFAVFWPAAKKVFQTYDRAKFFEPTYETNDAGVYHRVDSLFGQLNSPEIWEEFRIVVRSAWSVVLLLETVAGAKGLGVLVWTSRSHSGAIVAGIIVSAVCVYLTDLAIKAVGTNAQRYRTQN